MPLTVFYDPVFEQHNTGPTHPERPARLEAIIAGLEQGGLTRSSFARPRVVNPTVLAAVHPQGYVALAERVCAATPDGSIAELPTGDTIVSPRSYDIALIAAGAAVDAAEFATAQAPSLALVRPPGHHAEPARGMGFCLFNNVAVAAAWALRERGSVLIADFDYHHGNGTQAWVEQALGRDARGLGFVSTHAYPAYPGTGAFDESFVNDRGFVLDIPLAHSTDTEDFVNTWTSLLSLAAARIRPRTLLVSAGFDFLAGDPIAGLPVAPRAVDALCALLGDVAAEHSAALAFVLEGGYALDNLRASGASLATNFGTSASSVHIPDAHPPRNQKLLAMVDEVKKWIK
jgi:acetoin utilization deacetylase AcuC-like enzyme